MPSPIGHAMAGIAAAWTADLVPGQRAWRAAPESASWFLRAGSGVTLVCAGLGAAADLDLLFGGHRTVTHSLAAVVFVWVLAVALAANAGRPIVRVGLMCAAAYATHLLLDWMGVDRFPPRGIELLWPLNREWYISGLEVFRQTARLRIFTHGPMITNLRAILQEIAILLPMLAVLWLGRRGIKN